MQQYLFHRSVLVHNLAYLQFAILLLIRFLHISVFNHRVLTLFILFVSFCLLQDKADSMENAHEIVISISIPTTVTITSISENFVHVVFIVYLLFRRLLFSQCNWTERKRIRSCRIIPKNLITFATKVLLFVSSVLAHIVDFSMKHV